jgi:hypothetical protein
MRTWTRGQVALRLVVLAGPLVALLARALGGDAPAVLSVMLVAVSGAAAARYPESPAGTVAAVLVLLSWANGIGTAVPAAAVVAAAGLLAAHVAAVLASYGPDDLPLDRDLTLRWTVRGLVALVAAPVVWALAAALRAQPEPGGVWVAGLCAVIVAVLFADIVGRHRGVG